ncbi:MAG TPA: hypothetical protein VIK63_05585 [Haloplasmataceae bacterium]
MMITTGTFLDPLVVLGPDVPIPDPHAVHAPILGAPGIHGDQDLGVLVPFVPSSRGDHSIPGHRGTYLPLALLRANSLMKLFIKQ